MNNEQLHHNQWFIFLLSHSFMNVHLVSTSPLLAFNIHHAESRVDSGYKSSTSLRKSVRLALQIRTALNTAYLKNGDAGLGCTKRSKTSKSKQDQDQEAFVARDGFPPRLIRVRHASKERSGGGGGGAGNACLPITPHDAIEHPSAHTSATEECRTG